MHSFTCPYSSVSLSADDHLPVYLPNLSTYHLSIGKHGFALVFPIPIENCGVCSIILNAFDQFTVSSPSPITLPLPAPCDQFLHPQKSSTVSGKLRLP